MKQEVVVIESGKGRSKFDLLDAALKEARFEELLDEAWRKKGKDKKEFLVCIKPNLAMFFKDALTITDSQLVEHLVDRIYDLGYPNVLVGEAQNSFKRWLENREIENIAFEAGYEFWTPMGRTYRVIDLDKRQIDRATEYRIPEKHSIRGLPLSKDWLEADFRISFAKNKTHEQYFYTLCLKNLLGAIPQWDKHLHYHTRLKVWDVCLELYQRFPVHFNIIDAYESSHGTTGAQVANPVKTETIIAGGNTLLVDWVGALKMGIDPYVSPLNKKALESIGLPEDYQVIGSLAPYEGWVNAHPLISRLFFRLEEADRLRHFLWPASFTNDGERFPWVNWYDRWINMASHLWAWGDKTAILLWLFIVTLYGMVLGVKVYTIWLTLFNKKKLRRKELPINVPLDRYREQSYEELPRFIRPLEEAADALPKKDGMAHTFVDGGMLFYLEREVDLPFEVFAKRMDVCKAVTHMKDYVGGNTVQVKRDDQQGLIHQIERTVFLPQPNLMVLLNAKDIDVTKIERVVYGERMHKIIWRTIHCDNGSARFDEGAVTFEKVSYRTRLKVVVHQSFPFPYLLRWIKLRYFVGFRRSFMLFFYKRYFKKTLDNYCDVVRGEYERLGRYWIKTEDVPSLKVVRLTE